MGAVYLAQDDRDGRSVALKVLRGDRLSAEAVDRLQHEFRAMACLRHPRLAAAYDFGYLEHGGTPFYTSEYIEGEPLPAGPPSAESPAEFLRPIIDVLEALEYLHDHDVLHLDVHAGNVLVSRDPKRGAVLIDLGLIRSAEAPRLSFAAGEWATLPPELARGESATRRSDVFLVGRLLLYRLTGRHHGDVDLPREIPGWGTRTTLEIERIAAKAVQPNPTQRFPSAAAFRQALARTLGTSEQRRGDAVGIEVLVGREQELEKLEQSLRTAGSPPMYQTFAGRRGIGKSRLLEEARIRAQLRGLDVVPVRFARESGGAELLKTLGSGRRRRDRWLQPLDTRHGGTPEERAQRCAEAYFAELGAPPLVLILDDVDRADPESGVLIDAFRREVARRRDGNIVGRGLIVFASQTDPRTTDDVTTTVLRRLHRDDASELLAVYLKPLTCPPALTREAVETGRGSPHQLRRLALALKSEWRGGNSIPETATLPPVAEEPGRLSSTTWKTLSATARQIVESLAILQRAATASELAAVMDASKNSIDAPLRELVHAEIIDVDGRGKGRFYHLLVADAGNELETRRTRLRQKTVHRRAAEYLQSLSERDVRASENLARHLLRSGRQKPARDLAIEIGRPLAAEASYERSVRLLEELLEAETTWKHRLRLSEVASALLEEFGDHRRGARLLRPLYDVVCAPDCPADPRDGVRIRRQLGMHLHRAGAVDEARRVFEEAQAVAAEEERPEVEGAAQSRRRHVDRDNRVGEDLIFIDSELAELHIFQGDYPEAEAACLRSLERLKTLPETEFRGRMEMVLRASLGHLSMRRWQLQEALVQLEAARHLSRRFGTTSEQGAILNNLGIVENHLNRFTKARKRFREAERVLLKAGELRSVVQIATNLAVIAAKVGERAEAQQQLDRAAQMVRHYPGKRLEFFVMYARGVTASLFANVEEATVTLAEAIRVGEELGDRYLANFARVFLAEAHLLSGRYREALTILEALRKGPSDDSAAVLTRMALSRLQVVESLLGRHRRATTYERDLDRLPRSDLEVVEAWNDLWRGVAGILLQRSSADASLENALTTFKRLGLANGERWARLGKCLLARSRDASPNIAPLQHEEGAGGQNVSHAFLDVAEPLLAAALADVPEAPPGEDGRLVGLRDPHRDERVGLGHVGRDPSVVRQPAGLVRGDADDGHVRPAVAAPHLRRVAPVVASETLLAPERDPASDGLDLVVVGAVALPQACDRRPRPEVLEDVRTPVEPGVPLLEDHEGNVVGVAEPPDPRDERVGVGPLAARVAEHDGVQVARAHGDLGAVDLRAELPLEAQHEEREAVAAEPAVERDDAIRVEHLRGPPHIDPLERDDRTPSEALDLVLGELARPGEALAGEVAEAALEDLDGVHVRIARDDGHRVVRDVHRELGADLRLEHRAHGSSLGARVHAASGGWDSDASGRSWSQDSSPIGPPDQLQLIFRISFATCLPGVRCPVVR